MKRLVTFFILVPLLLWNCSKESNLEKKEFIQENLKMSEQAAFESFAAILSKAVYENVELRTFLKEEALKQYDRDYDVFFPFIKNQCLSSGESIYSLLSSYARDVVQLEEIEAAAPKLTILIPDFSWINADCFSVLSWDTTLNNVCVGFDDRALAHKIFYNGDFLGELSSGSIPTFPVLIVKSNERMEVLPSKTKTGVSEYIFADPAFDGTRDKTIKTKGHIENYYDNPNSVIPRDAFSVTGNSISYYELNSISPSSIGAYNEFGVGSLGAAQRDYIFYGMTTTNTNNGTLNPYMRDLLYRIRFTPAALFNMSDDTSEPSLSTFYTGRDDRPGFNEALARFWGNGNYEIRVQYYQDSNNGGAGSIGTTVLSIAPSEIMYISRMYVTFDWNFWGNNWSSYTIYAADIEPKWYYPGDKNNPLQTVNTSWNLATMSDNIWIKVCEYDPSTTVTYSKTATFKQSYSVSSSSNSTWEKVGYGVSGSYGDEVTHTETFSVTKTTGSDDLGDCWMTYMDNTITASTNGNTFQLKSIGNEYFAITYVPIDIRNEYQIQQFLLGRKNR